jgi:hypothetical protein
MRIAHLIIAHKNPGQLERLIVTMKHTMFDLYIHLDKKTDIASFRQIERHENVYFIKNRIVCNWGGYSIVRAILNSIDEVLNSGKEYEFINLMSGQDYPLKSTNDIYQYLSERLGNSFVAYEPLDNVWWVDAVTRYEFYHFTDLKLIGRYFLQKIVNALMPRRKFPLNLTLYGSKKSTWWVLNADAARYLVSFVQDNSKLDRFMKFTWGADEFLITSIIMNSPFKDKVVNDNLRYVDWSSGDVHPKILSKDDLPDLIKADQYFARKFDITVDEEILDLIDQKNKVSLMNNYIQ